MTTAARDIRLSVIGETRAYQAELAKIPGITQREAARASALFAREATKAQAEAARAAAKAAKDAAGAWEEFGREVGSALGAEAILRAGQGLFDFVNNTMQARTEIIAFSKATGIGTDTLTALQVAADRSGVSFESITGGMEDFGEKLFDFTQGGGSAQEALEILGFTGEEIESRFGDVDGVFRDVVERMSGLEDAALRSTVATQLFSDTGNQLNAALAGGSIEDFIGLAEQYGVVLDQQAVQNTEEWTRAVADLKGALAGATAELIDFVNLDQGVRNFTLGFVFLKEFGVATFEVLGRRAIEFNNVFELLFQGRLGEAVDAWMEFGDTGDEAFQEVKDRALAAAKGFFDTTREIDAATDATEQQTTAVGELSSELDKQRVANEKAARERAKQLRDEEAATRKILAANDAIAKSHRDATDDILTDEQQIQQAFDERIDALMDAIEAGGSLDAANAAFADAEQRRVRDLAQLDRDRIFERMELERQLNEMLAEAEVIRQEAIQDSIRLGQRFAEMALEGFGNIVTAAENSAARELQAIQGSLAGQEAARSELQGRLEEAATAAEEAEIARQIAALDRVIALNEEVEAAEQDHVTRLFRTRQGLEAAGAVISGAAGAAAALAPPPIGLGPILGPALAIATIGLAATQVGVILSQQPPQFHTGFAGFTEGPDEFTATMRSGETVANQATTDALGGPRAIQAMNQSSGALGRGPMVVPVMVGGRELGRAIVDELATGRELSRAMNRRGGRRTGVRPVYQVR